jgi:CRP-like cAMP-binding protein
MSLPLYLSAGLYGLLVASGLALGAVIGLVVRPRERIVAAVMAFGGGTLIVAVAFGLCQESFRKGGPAVLVGGFLLGGLGFVLADKFINSKGGFLRREGIRAAFLREKKDERANEILARLAEIELIRSLPPDEVQAIVPYVEERTFADGTVVFRKGDEGDALYLVLAGHARVTDDGRTLASLGTGSAFGEMALLSGEARNATVVAEGPLRAYRIGHDDFHHLMTRSRALADAVHRLLAERLDRRGQSGDATTAETWRKVASRHLDRSLSEREERALVEANTGSHAGVAIFLGALADAVPESLIIGATLAPTRLPSISFMLAVFIANFPEAMSSASGLTRAGFSRRRIMGMWLGLVGLSGVCALLGNVFLATASPVALALAESLAGGAILALLANTMMPEAFEQGGRAAAICTIVGFLVAFLTAALTGQH